MLLVALAHPHATGDGAPEGGSRIGRSLCLFVYTLTGTLDLRVLIKFLGASDPRLEPARTGISAILALGGATGCFDVALYAAASTVSSFGCCVLWGRFAV